MSTVKYGGYTHSLLVQQMQEGIQRQRRLNELISKEFELLLDQYSGLQISKPIMYVAMQQIEITKLIELNVELRKVVIKARKKRGEPEADEIASTLADMQRQIDELKAKGSAAEE